MAQKKRLTFEISRHFILGCPKPANHHLDGFAKVIF